MVFVQPQMLYIAYYPRFCTLGNKGIRGDLRLDEEPVPGIHAEPVPHNPESPARTFQDAHVEAEQPGSDHDPAAEATEAEPTHGVAEHFDQRLSDEPSPQHEDNDEEAAR